jgi:hypothetical protein
MAYYVVDRVLSIEEVTKNRNIVAKYKNPHIERYPSGEKDEYIVFGDPIISRVLDIPLLFNRELSERLSLNIRFDSRLTEIQKIASATRNWRVLNDMDLEVLLEAIERNKKAPSKVETILSTEEVVEIVEIHLENAIAKNPSIIGKAMKFKDRQVSIPVGRIDLLYENKDGSPVVVELKIGDIGKKVIDQIRRYMNWISKDSGKEASGVIVCKGVMPAFKDDIKSLKNIRVFCYGWQLKIFPWETYD